jgi:hypothetical protein
VGGICAVFVYRVPDFRVVIFQYLLSSTDKDFVVSDGCIISRSGFGQIVYPLLTYQTRVPFDPVECYRVGVS